MSTLLLTCCFLDVYYVNNMLFLDVYSVTNMLFF